MLIGRANKDYAKANWMPVEQHSYIQCNEFCACGKYHGDNRDGRVVKYLAIVICLPIIISRSLCSVRLNGTVCSGFSFTLMSCN